MFMLVHFSLKQVALVKVFIAAPFHLRFHNYLNRKEKLSCKMQLLKWNKVEVLMDCFR